MERVHSYTPVYFAIYLSVGVGSCRKLRQFGVQGSGWIFLILSSLKAVGSRSIMIFKILLYFFLPPRVRSSRLWCCWLCRSSAPVVFPLLNFVDIKTYVYLNLSFHLPIYSTAFARRLTLFILVKAGCPSGETKEKKRGKELHLAGIATVLRPRWGRSGLKLRSIYISHAILRDKKACYILRIPQPPLDLCIKKKRRKAP